MAGVGMKLTAIRVTRASFPIGPVVILHTGSSPLDPSEAILEISSLN